MSRTDGKFPGYTKLDISAEDWPDKYWEKSRACAECGYRWPYPHLFQPSPCCGAFTTLIDEAPSLRWPEAVSRLFHERFEKFYDEYNEGLTDDKLDWEDLKTDGHYDEQKGAAAVDALLKDTQNGNK